MKNPDTGNLCLFSWSVLRDSMLHFLLMFSLDPDSTQTLHENTVYWSVHETIERTVEGES